MKQDLENSHHEMGQAGWPPRGLRLNVLGEPFATGDRKQAVEIEKWKAGQISPLH